VDVNFALNLMQETIEYLCSVRGYVSIKQQIHNLRKRALGVNTVMSVSVLCIDFSQGIKAELKE
jgi:hypothetical protein